MVELVKGEPNARIHAVACVVVVAAGTYYRISKMEWIAVVLCIALVISLEAVNTAIEHLTNLVSPFYNPIAGKVKDVAAAAVLVAAIAALIVGLIIFLPKIGY